MQIPVPSILAFASHKIALNRATAVLVSPFTGKSQRVSSPYAVWTFAGETVTYDGLDAGIIRSFFVSLEGRRNTITLPVPGCSGPLTGYSGTAGKVSVAALAGASTISVSGLTPNTVWLAKGDYFTINGELKMVSAGVQSGVTGTASLSFQPPLRFSAAANTAIEINNPTVTLAADDDSVASWQLEAPAVHGFSFSGTEAF